LEKRIDGQALELPRCRQNKKTLGRAALSWRLALPRVFEIGGLAMPLFDGELAGDDSSDVFVDGASVVHSVI